MVGRKGILTEWRIALPLTSNTPKVSLGEGGTPLIYAKRLQQEIQKKTKCSQFNLWLKYEGANPTGSFKDRGMVVAVAKALERGARALICASTGNTSASASAYAAQVGIPCFVFIPKGKVAPGKLAQILIHGAKIFEVKGNFDQAMAMVGKIAAENPELELVNSTNPYRLEGQKTAAFEICEMLKAMPDIHCIPVGNAGNITAYWKGFKEYARSRRWTKLPKMFGFQARGSAPIVRGKIVERPRTVATAIQIGNPVHWDGALKVIKESSGGIFAITDQEILEAQFLIASYAGIFCEPASAASVAGLIKLANLGLVPEGAKVTCTLTGAGLKDAPQAAHSAQKKNRAITVAADDFTAIEEELKKFL